MNRDQPHIFATRAPSFVVLSDDWGRHVSSSQHIFRRLARDHDVLWVNTIGMRNPALTIADLRKALYKVSRMAAGSGCHHLSDVEDRSSVTVCQPLMLPFSEIGAVRAFNARSVTRSVHAALIKEGFTDPIVVSTVPNAGDYEAMLPGSTLVYYCVDDFSLWPGQNAKLARDMEARLIARADMLVATSEVLYERLSASGKPTRLLTHGVDVELFSTPCDREHPCLSGMSRPRAGFFGLIDGRMDQDLVARVAQRMPQFSFVFAGPVQTPLRELSFVSNVHFVGPLRYADLPLFVAGLNVLMLPYKAGELAEALSPLKLKEYLVTGKPIVSSAIAEARARSAYITLASSGDDWVLALRSALHADVSARRKALTALMAEESWESKAQSLLTICATAKSKRFGDARGNAGPILTDPAQ